MRKENIIIFLTWKRTSSTKKSFIDEHQNNTTCEQTMKLILQKIKNKESTTEKQCKLQEDERR